MKYAVAISLALAGALSLACGGDDPVVVVNQPPTIAFTFNQLGVQRNVPVNLSVSVSDPDEGDALAVSWSITRGPLTPMNPAKTIMQWLPPDETGADTVVVTVSDGEASAQVVEPIYVATRQSNNDAPAVYEIVDSPFLISPSAEQLLVPEGGSTVIDAGVMLLIDKEGIELQVLGTLDVQGTADAPVVIRPNDRTLQCQSGRGWWAGIHVRSGIVSSGHMNLSHAEVRYGETNVLVSEGATAVISDSRLVCGLDAGAKMAGNRWMRLERCEIASNASYGVDIYGIASNPDSVTILWNTIAFNGNTGIHMQLDDTSQEARITVARNRLEFNATNGILLEQSVFPDIHQNHFAFNGHGGTLMNLRLRAYPGTVPFDTLDATLNYWGASFANPTGIENTVYDSLDDPTTIGTRVKVDPWLNTSPTP